MKADTWKVFKECFEEGEEVVVVLEDGKFDWGKLSYDEEGIDLAKGSGIASMSHDWIDIRFMAHDGFPVKKVMCPPTDTLLEKLDTTDIQDLIRQTLTYTLCGKCKEAIADPAPYVNCEKCREIQREKDRVWRENIDGRRRSFGFGHPFLIEGVSATLINKGNNGPEYYEMDYLIETLVLKSKDGAIAHLWDLESIFYFE